MKIEPAIRITLINGHWNVYVKHVALTKLNFDKQNMDMCVENYVSLIWIEIYIEHFTKF